MPDGLGMQKYIEAPLPFLDSLHCTALHYTVAKSGEAWGTVCRVSTKTIENPVLKGVKQTKVKHS